MSYCEIGLTRPAGGNKAGQAPSRKTRPTTRDDRSQAMDRLMNSVAVTLSDDLMTTLRREAEALGVPLEWVVASLVADTFNDGDNGLAA